MTTGPKAQLRELLKSLFSKAEELRSVYSVAYYPKNQDFDGGWRAVTIEVDRDDVRVRHRDGYFAQ